MSDNSRLSSEQALDDYFFDLLDDTVEEPAPACDIDEQPVDEQPVVVSVVQAPSEQELNNDDPRPVESGSDDQTVFEPAGVVDPVDAAASSVCAPFDFSSLSSDAEECELAAEPVASFFNDAPAPMSHSSLSHSSRFSALPLPESVPAPASRASWLDMPVERDDLQRLLSQVSVLSEPEPVIESVTESAIALEAEALADDWAMVMAHEAEQEGTMVQESEIVFPECALPERDWPERDLSDIGLANTSEMVIESVTDHDAREQLELVDMPRVTEPEIATEIASVAIAETASETALATQASADLPPDGWQQQEALGSAFQALFFDVNGVTFAVPLTALGGIHQLGEMNHLVGRPPWYFGLMTNRDQTMDVVDTARWVMPERLVDDEHREAFRYLVMLGESRWGLACDGLQGTQTLDEHSVRWRETAGKRPWLAGMVKEKMCALIHVSELIAMLDAGLDVQTTLQQA
ncbi:chemotaxis protein CheW [Photobacterium japonica]|uniref:chemotaxis protein CheW n=1 Tax=Photobacterium japonica TaxID=2910235 RepID=UPI003D1116BE